MAFDALNFFAAGIPAGVSAFASARQGRQQMTQQREMMDWYKQELVRQRERQERQDMIFESLITGRPIGQIMEEMGGQTMGQRPPTPPPIPEGWDAWQGVNYGEILRPRGGD